VNELQRPNEARFLTIGECAKIVGFHRDAIHDAMRKGRLRYSIKDGHRMATLADLRDLERRGVAR
jgi:predicted DNA-binding transcriptional regulator AlpA